MCSDCRPGVVLKKIKHSHFRQHILSFYCLYKFMLVLHPVPRVCCIYSSAGNGRWTSAGGFSLINPFSCLAMVNNGKIQKSNPSQITSFSNTDGALGQPDHQNECQQYLFLQIMDTLQLL